MVEAVFEMLVRYQQRIQDIDRMVINATGPAPPPGQ